MPYDGRSTAICTVNGLLLLGWKEVRPHLDVRMPIVDSIHGQVAPLSGCYARRPTTKIDDNNDESKVHKCSSVGFFKS